MKINSVWQVYSGTRDNLANFSEQVKLLNKNNINSIYLQKYCSKLMLLQLYEVTVGDYVEIKTTN